MRNKWVFLMFGILLTGMFHHCSAPQGSIFGTWALVPEKSTDIVTWRYRQMQVVVREAGEQIVLLEKWHRRNTIFFADSVAFKPGHPPVQMPVNSAIWPPNWYMGVLAIPGTMKQISGKWLEQPRKLQISVEQMVEISQGETQIRTTRDLTLNHAGDTLTIIEKRSSRPQPIKLVFQRVESQAL